MELNKSYLEYHHVKYSARQVFGKLDVQKFGNKLIKSEYYNFLI